MNTPTNSDLSNHPTPRPDSSASSDVDPGDQDIDTAATAAHDELASVRGDWTAAPLLEAYTSIPLGDAVDNNDKPIGLHDPSSMPRAEDDPLVRERSPEFHDRPGSGKYR